MMEPPNARFDAFRRAWLSAILAIGLITPSLVLFLVEVTAGKIPPLTSLRDIAHRQFAGGHNLFLLAVIGLVPFAVLAILLRFLSRHLTRGSFLFLSLCGLAGILAFMIPMHVVVWRPLYTDEHASSTAVIAFVFIPFYCVATMSVGLAAGALVSIPAWVRQSRERDNARVSSSQTTR
jgi:hypothetical protein